RAHFISPTPRRSEIRESSATSARQRGSSVAVLETQAYRHEWQHQETNDHAIGLIIHIQALEAGARIDTLEDTGSSA
ncbi:hypothetical protein Tco_0718859, partial [Tanacetum coccineum]